MPPNTGLRRSSRLRALHEKQPNPNNSIQKSTPRPPTAKDKKKQISSWLKKTSPIPKAEQASRYVSAEASDTDADSDDDSEESESEIAELIDLTAENFEYEAAHDTSRHSSYDSRGEPGNEAYELDDFVVGDSEEEDEKSECESESDKEPEAAPITTKRRLIRKIGPKKWTVESPQSAASRKSQSSSSSTRSSKRSSASRRSSSRKSSSTSSKLFYTDSNDSLSSVTRRSSVIVTPSPTRENVSEMLISEDPVEIAEQINDAISLFSRRSNRARPPVVLLLSEAALNDYDLREALDTAVRLELGEMIPSGGFVGEMWSIGPRESKRLRSARTV